MKKLNSIIAIVALFVCSLTVNAQNSAASSFETIDKVASQVGKFNEIATVVEALPATDFESEINAVIALSRDETISKELLKSTKKVQNAMEHNKSVKGDVISVKTMKMLDKQLKASHALVDAIDKYLAGKDVNENLYLVLTRDMLVEFCKTNAVLCQNDSEMDYWYNTTDILSEDAFAMAEYLFMK